MFAVQSWLAETPAQKAKSSTPGYFGVAMACKSAATGRCTPESTNIIVFSHGSCGGTTIGP